MTMKQQPQPQQPQQPQQQQQQQQPLWIQTLFAKVLIPLNHNPNTS